MKEQIYTASNGVKITYQHKLGKYDYNHLIIVFSGFLNEKPGNYDFLNALSDCPCDIIWINDNFDGMYSYYLCVDMNFNIEAAITEFIHEKMQSAGLSSQNVTMTGFSKGGSSALYYALRLDIENIVISVPQIFIGNYVHSYWKKTAIHMMGIDYSQIQIQYLNNLLPSLLTRDKNLSRNIYLLTSESDSQYLSEITPNLDYFKKYSNFNLLKTHSLFVRQHNQVTGHHTTLLLSIYYALASEAVPRFNQGIVNFFGRQEVALSRPKVEPYVDLRSLKIIDDRLYIDGVALLRGIDTQEYSDIDYKLFLKGESITSFNLAKANRPSLTRELFDRIIVIYDKCWFTTYQYKGIDISVVQKGTYELWINIKAKSFEDTVKLTSIKNIKINEDHFYFESNKQSNIFTIK